MKKVYILTGGIATGKTTRLLHWASSQESVNGIFQPIINDKRFIYHLGSRTLKLLETADNESVSIGSYKFSIKTFEWAKEALLKCLIEEPEWIIIDEIGPLEIRGEGLEPVIARILSLHKTISSKIICIVRENLLQKFINHYGLDDQYELLEL